MTELKEFIRRFLFLQVSYFVAICRLITWMCVLFVSGLQQIIFNRTEICHVESRGIPLMCDREGMLNNLSYIDKLKEENPDLIDIFEEPTDEELEELEGEDYTDEEDNGEEE